MHLDLIQMHLFFNCNDHVPLPQVAPLTCSPVFRSFNIIHNVVTMHSQPRRLAPAYHQMVLDEAVGYYTGLPSSPRLVARTSKDAWVLPVGPEGRPKPKRLEVLVNHRLGIIWEIEVGPKIVKYLNEEKICWTSLDVVRIGVVGRPSVPILWIGVEPKSLSSEMGNTAVLS
jgi:hypothetical protein